MDMLLAGLLLWSGVHFIPGFLPGLKVKLLEKLGNGYRGLFALLIVISIILMVLGWRSIEPELVYATATWGFDVGRYLMIFSFFLISCAYSKVNVKCYIRNPMLCGVLVWSTAHLIANGDNRSVMLFGGMIIWALLEMWIIDRRDGTWIKQEPVALMNDIKAFAIALAVFFAVGFAHPYISDVVVI